MSAVFKAGSVSSQVCACNPAHKASGSALERTAAHDGAHEHAAVARRRKLCPSKVCPAVCFPPRSPPVPTVLLPRSPPRILDTHGSTSEMGEPLRRTRPRPGVTCATAVAVFFLPKHWTADIFFYANETSGTRANATVQICAREGGWMEVGGT